MKYCIGIFILALVISCGTDNGKSDNQSDRKSNGGMIRFVLNDKTMHDRYFVAQFTPRGHLFETDNLQLYNYRIDSDKYPQIFFNLDYKESDLNKWRKSHFHSINLPLSRLKMLRH